jgi:hypothetical protein
MPWLALFDNRFDKNSSSSALSLRTLDRSIVCIPTQRSLKLRLAEISDMSAGNAFLPEFMKQYNEKFPLSAVKAEDLHRRLNVQAPRLADILCHREQRHVGQQLSLAYDAGRSS